LNTDEVKITETWGPDPAELEKRIAALEVWANRQMDRIAALEDIVVKLGARHELLAVKHHERIAALEKIAAIEERLHEVKEERSR